MLIEFANFCKEVSMFSLLKKFVPILVTGLLVFSLFACSPATTADEGIVVVIPEDPPSFNPAITPLESWIKWGGPVVVKCGRTRRLDGSSGISENKAG